MKQDVVEKLNNIILFAVIYTAIFITLYLTMPYILPFVLGTIIALVSQRPINYLTSKFKVKRGLVGLIVVLIIFTILMSILGLAISKVVAELIELSSTLPKLFVQLKEDSYKYLDMGAAYYKMLDPSIIESIKGSANKIFTGSLTAAAFIVNFALNILKSLPGIIMLFLFTLLSAVYISIDLPRIKRKLFSIFNAKDSSTANNIIVEANKMLGGYAKAYLILISITFLITYAGTSILGLKYALVLSIITSISDLLPILGPGTVLIPVGVIHMITGSMIQGVGIVLIYIVLTVERQILEPRIVSSSLGVYPLAILAAIYIGVKSYGLTGMLFFVFLVVFYVVMQKVGLL